MGMSSIVAPLFEVAPVDWAAPDASEYDALFLTSANAPRHAGRQLAALSALPCYCVGGATAAEARVAGLHNLRIGSSDGSAMLADMAGRGLRRVLHLCGRDHMGLEHPQVSITRAVVYAADPVADLSVEAKEALRAGAVALLHSPRAARRFADLVAGAGLARGAISLAAISGNVAAAAGGGWKSCAVAAKPQDQALLELAAQLCNIAGLSGTGLGR
jgi:uroporphyrinogen-III synthase